MKNAGAVAVVLGFVVWISGEVVGTVPYNLVGLLAVIVGAILYYAGRGRADPE